MEHRTTLAGEVLPQTRSVIISVKNNKTAFRNSCPNARNGSEPQCNWMLGNPALKSQTEGSMRQGATGCHARLFSDTGQNTTEFQIPYAHGYKTDNIAVLGSNIVPYIYVKKAFSSFISISLYLTQNSNCLESFLQQLL